MAYFDGMILCSLMVLNALSASVYSLIFLKWFMGGLTLPAIFSPTMEAMPACIFPRKLPMNFLILIFLIKTMFPRLLFDLFVIRSY